MPYRIRQLLALFLAGFFIAPGVVFAERKKRSPGVNRREHRQKNRIKEGVKSGELSKDEAQTLRQEQKAIRQEEREMKSDGTFTKEERKELHKELNEASQNIYEEKHDAEKR